MADQDEILRAVFQITKEIGHTRSDIQALREMISDDRAHNRSHIAMLVTSNEDQRREISALQARPALTDARARAIDEIMAERAEKHEDTRERKHLVIDKLLLAALAPLTIVFGGVGTVIAHRLGLA